MRRFLLASLVLASTAQSQAQDAPDPSTPLTPRPPPRMSLLREPLPSDVVVDVDGVQLTRGEWETQSRIRVAAKLAGLERDKLPASAEDTITQQERRRVLDQFIAKSLLLSEAERRGIRVTPEQEAAAFDRLRAQIPSNTTLEAIMQKSPVGPERMREEVLVGIRISALLSHYMTHDVLVSEDEITQFRARNRESVSTPETVHPRHILVGVSPEDGVAEKATKLQKAEAIRNKLLDGAAFAEVASEYSDCPSGKQGGDLGTFGRGKMVKPFEAAVFSQETGDIGPVFETRFGYHIVQVLARTDASAIPNQKIIEIIRQRKRSSATEQLLEKLRAKAVIKVRN